MLGSIVHDPVARLPSRVPVSRRSSAGRFGGLIPLAATLAACVSAPSASVVSGHGIVRAPTTAEAAEVAVLLEDLHPRVQRMLPGTRSTRVEVWLQDRLRIFWMLEPSQEVVALNFDAWDRIHLKRGSDSLSEDLAHELVHLMLDDSWSCLPPVLEEGLADHVGITLHPAIAPDFRAGRLLSVIADLGGYSGRIRFENPTPSGAECLVFRLLEPPDHAVEPLDALRPFVEDILPHSRSEAKSTLYGLGFLVISRIVDRVGYQGLHAEFLVAKEQGLEAVPTERLLELARLDHSSASWVEAALDLLGEAELRALADQQSVSLASMLAGTCAPLFPGMRGADFLERMRPALALRREGPEVVLGEIPAFRQALCEVWPRAYSAELLDLRAEQ